MSEPFSRSLRSTRADNFKLTVVSLVIIVVLSLLWSVWFFFSKVSLYAVTKTARLEVDQEAHPVEAPISGRVIATAMRLGSEVRQGQLLVELDSELIRLELEEARAKQAGIAGQLGSLEKEVQAQNRALEQARRAESSAVDETRAQYDEAEAGAKLAEGEAERVERIHEQGLVSDSERKRASAEADQRRAAAVAKFRISRATGSRSALRPKRKASASRGARAPSRGLTVRACHVRGLQRSARAPTPTSSNCRSRVRPTRRGGSASRRVICESRRSIGGRRPTGCRPDRRGV